MANWCICQLYIHLLMFGSFFALYPLSLQLSENITNKLLTSRCVSARIHLLAMVYILHIYSLESDIITDYLCFCFSEWNIS